MTKCLTALVDEGLLERRQYLEKPPRYEYVLTESGRAFKPVLIALLAWGNAHFTPDGLSVVLADRQTGATSNPILVDAASGKPISEENYVLVAGPAANEGIRKRMAYAEKKRSAPDQMPNFTTDVTP